MKRCLCCDAGFSTQGWRCPSCGWQPEARGGFPLFSPGLMEDGAGFPTSAFAQLAVLEAGSFWFRARNALLIWALGKHGAGVRSFMEIGCGTGFVLQGIGAAFPAVRLVGAEGSAEGLAFAVGRMPRAQFMQMDARDIPFLAEFDAVGAFDVIEHIEEDEAVLRQLHQALKPGGLLMLTVPQHGWLWSAEDEHAGHVRRYTSGGLHAKVTRAGFDLVESTSFVTTLLPAMWLSRIIKRRRRVEGTEASGELRLNPSLDRLFESCLRAELFLVRLGVPLPIGGSRLVVARSRTW